MSAPKFTPGPWALTQSARWPWSYTICGGDVEVLSYGLYTYSTDDNQQSANAREGNAESHANARLIAAAPELYEALSEILKWADPYALPNCGEHEADVAFARMALAKARGKS